MSSSRKTPMALSLAAAIALASAVATAGTDTKPSSSPATAAIAPASAPSSIPASASAPASSPVKTMSVTEAPASSDDPLVQDVRQSMRRLWLESVQPPADSDPAGDLVQAIQRLDAMNVSRKEPTKEPVVVVAASNPTTTSAPANVAVAQELTGAVLEKLKALSPDDLEDPAAVADQLYQAGQPSAACILYELALKKNSEGQDKAWLLLQIGNCKVKTDQAAALAMYRQVVADFPSSCWAAIAQSKVKLIEWCNQNNPQALAKPSEK